MIRFNGVTKYFPTAQGRKVIFDNLSFEMPPKSNIGVLGLNGSGKSTMLRMIGGLDYPNSGSIDIEGSLSWPMGLSGGVQSALTGRENAKFVCRIYGDSGKDIRKKVAFIKEFSELDEYFELPVKSYSSGMRSRLTFAISMAFDFDIYLMDELSSVGDARFREKSMAALREKASKSNYIMVSHNTNELINGCDVILVLENRNVSIYHDKQEGLEFYRQSIRVQQLG